MAAAAAIGAAIAWVYLTRAPVGTPQPTGAHADSAPIGFGAKPLPDASTVTQQRVATPDKARESRQPANPEIVARWIVDATAIDPKTRADAITALAAAPKAQAVPVLRKVLTVGDPQVDRQLALDSLHVLALGQGDSDGTIRKVLRDVIYHGDDTAVGQSAQSILEDIESESCLASAQNACDSAQ
jgi:hypothetical protein